MLPGLELYISTNRMIRRCLKRRYARAPGSTYQCPTKYKYHHLHRCYSRGIFARATDSYTPVDHLSTCHLFPARQDAPSQVGVVLLPFDWREKFTAIMGTRGDYSKNSGCVQSGPEWENKSTGAHLIDALVRIQLSRVGTDLARQQF
jgi:hypothetical protein